MKRFSAIAVCLITVFAALTFSAFAEYSDTVGRVNDLIGGIVDYELKNSGAKNIQEWIDGSLTEKAGIGAEWYMLALAGKDYDFSSYARALSGYMSGDRRINASTKQRALLVAKGVGLDDTEITEKAISAIGEQGIMSYVFGLHILNSGFESESFTKDEAAETILSMRLSKGGWAVSGEYEDVDVTAMTLQALAPLCENPEIKEAVDKALDYLSEKQQSDGDYMSYGKANAESTAQVLCALSVLGIDFGTDERFIKNGNTVLDGLVKYRMPDGSFMHEKDGGTNNLATSQAFFALESYIAMTEGRNIYAVGERTNEQVKEEVSAVPDKEAHEQTSSFEAAEVQSVKSDYKPIAYIVTGVLASAVILFFIISGKRRVSNFVVAAAAAAGICCFIFFTDFSSAENYYGTKKEKSGIVGSVTMSIDCKTLIDKAKNELVPKDGIILSEKSYDFSADETAYDILVQAARENEIQIDGSGDYVAGIAYLYEFDYGDLSGWMYYVNGEAPSVNCGNFSLSDGDVIEWRYTCNIGKDLE